MKLVSSSSSYKKKRRPIISNNFKTKVISEASYSAATNRNNCSRNKSTSRLETKRTFNKNNIDYLVYTGSMRDENDDDSDIIILSQSSSCDSMNSDFSMYDANTNRTISTGTFKKNKSGKKSKLCKSKKKSVSFHKVYVRTYGRILGDHPDCTNGPPLSLNWCYRQEKSVTLENHIMLMNEKRRNRERQFESLQAQLMRQSNATNQRYGRIQQQQQNAKIQQMQQQLLQSTSTNRRGTLKIGPIGRRLILKEEYLYTDEEIDKVEREIKLIHESRRNEISNFRLEQFLNYTTSQFISFHETAMKSVGVPSSSSSSSSSSYNDFGMPISFDYNKMPSPESIGNFIYNEFIC